MAKRRILKEARDSLTTKQKADERESDKLRTALSIYTKEKETEILNKSNEIAALQLKLEQQLSFGTRLRVTNELPSLFGNAALEHLAFTVLPCVRLLR